MLDAVASGTIALVVFGTVIAFVLALLLFVVLPFTMTDNARVEDVAGWDSREKVKTD